MELNLIVFLSLASVLSFRPGLPLHILGREIGATLYEILISLDSRKEGIQKLSKKIIPTVKILKGESLFTLLPIENSGILSPEGQGKKCSHKKDIVVAVNLKT